jgi:hypothetical protein
MQNRENPYGANDLNWLMTVLVVGALFLIFLKLFQ